MHDKIRYLIIIKFDLRRKIGGNMNGKIIPSVIETLNDQSKAIKDHEVVKIGDGTTKVIVSNIRHAVNLEQKSCTCRAWQVIEKSCSHALAFIATLSREVDMADLVHQYYSVDMFRKAYAGVFTPMTSKQLWTRVDLGYTIKKPQLRRKPSRPRVSRIKALDEASKKKKRECSECHEFKHTTKYCQGGPTTSQKKRRLSSTQEREVMLLVLHIHLSDEFSILLYLSSTNLLTNFSSFM
jgi:hypothetical protein